jgi:hypothetical protein
VGPQNQVLTTLGLELSQDRRSCQPSVSSQKNPSATIHE